MARIDERFRRARLTVSGSFTDLQALAMKSARRRIGFLLSRDAAERPVFPTRMKSQTTMVARTRQTTPTPSADPDALQSFAGSDRFPYVASCDANFLTQPELLLTVDASRRRLDL